MDKSYWNLFWTTGLPEAWLLTRGGITADRPGAGEKQAPPEDPLVSVYPRITGQYPGGPMGLY